MTHRSRSRDYLLSRREALRTGALAAAALALGHGARSRAAEGEALPLVTRPIGTTGERLPVVGLGTNAYGVATREEIAARREVLGRMPELGGTVVDTAPAYGESEAVIGECLAALGNRDRLFLATKVTARGGDLAAARAMLEASFRRLRTERIDLIQVHNLAGVDVLLPLLREWQEKGRFRFVGITTSNASQYPQMLASMRDHPLDFIQVDYSIGNRGAAERILPLAQERGIAVLVNMPFGGRSGGNLFGEVAGRELPEWADEIDVGSWAQFLLKYVVSHPAVTCAIPGTTRLKHLEDNQRGARGRLPDAATRRRMEQLWDAAA